MAKIEQILQFLAVLIQTLNVIVTKIPVNVLQWWIEHPEDRQRFLLGLCKIPEEPTCLWHLDADGTIRFTVTSNGRTGEQWIAHFEAKGIYLSSYAKSVLRSKKFRATSGVVYNIAVIPGKFWDTNDERRTKAIRKEAEETRKWQKPEAEVGCLIRDLFTDEEIAKMGLTWIITMHEPIEDSDGSPGLLGTDRYDGPRLDAYYGRPDGRWSASRGFAFAVPASI